MGPIDDRTDSYDYVLPAELLAHYPAERRDNSRLLVIPPDSNAPFVHAHFYDLPSLLRNGDLLIRNDVRVFRARLIGTRLGDHGEKRGRCEFLLLRSLAGESYSCGSSSESLSHCAEEWIAFVKPASRLRVGMRIEIESGMLRVTLVASAVESEGRAWRVRLETDCSGGVSEAVQRCGRLPLPPYIYRPEGAVASDEERYQTVYAGPIGAVAAPTAGLHFTEEVDNALLDKGIALHSITLYVGPGTFRPVTASSLSAHRMDGERFFVPPATLDALRVAKKEHRRVICVGTTSVRALETLPVGIEEDGDALCGGYAGESALFIRPGFVFRWTEGLITNFHLPRSTLLALISALVGRERVLSVYALAIREGYRFYSYGDACLFFR